MGFNVVALAQKARTQTLIVDSDLNMGNYDLIATDVKGDTAEFSEFVGGVGNFTSGLISGGLDVSGILHAEGNTQVDGNIILEGSINNVNIADDGAITTSKSITATGGFVGSISGGTVAGTNGTFSGAVSGTTGTFSGAVTGASFNGNLAGKLTVSSYTTSGTGGIRVYTCNAPSTVNGTMTASDQTFNLGAGTVTYYNTQIFNCTSINRNITCTVKLQRTNNTGDTYSITVTDNSTSGTQTKSLTVNGNSTGSTTFTIDSSHTHSIRIKCGYTGGVYTITGTATGYYLP